MVIFLEITSLFIILIWILFWMIIWVCNLITTCLLSVFYLHTINISFLLSLILMAFFHQFVLFSYKYMGYTYTPKYILWIYKVLPICMFSRLIIWARQPIGVPGGDHLSCSQLHMLSMIVVSLMGFQISLCLSVPLMLTDQPPFLKVLWY